MSISRALGLGRGLRSTYCPDILEGKANVEWFEIISEDDMVPGGRPLAMLDRVRADDPIVMPGVSRSLASTDPLDVDYPRELKALAEPIEPAWVSDHARPAIGAPGEMKPRDQPAREEAWALYELACRRFGDVAAMIERDDNFPPFSELLGGLEQMREIAARAGAENSRSAA